MYADDLSQDVSEKSVGVIEKKLQEDLKLSTEWMIKNKLSINRQKTQSMVIGTSIRLQNCKNLNTSVSCVQIEFVKRLSYWVFI